MCKKDGSNEPITHVCINKNTEKIIGDITDRSKCTEEEGIWTEITEEICTGETDEDKALGAKWSKVEKKRIEYAAYKPYALVTLPSQVYYGNIDRANKLSESLEETRMMFVFLSLLDKVDQLCFLLGCKVCQPVTLQHNK